MEGFVKGDIVVLPFPFSDLSSSKKRPALVLANLKGDDIILCQITSQYVKDEYALALNNIDFHLIGSVILGLIGYSQLKKVSLSAKLERLKQIFLKRSWISFLIL